LVAERALPQSHMERQVCDGLPAKLTSMYPLGYSKATAAQPWGI
jgi:hypothetical protein